jgi:hypothetical protein
VDQQTALLALLLPLKQRYSEADAKHSFRKCVSVMFLSAPRDDEEVKAIVNKLPAGKSVPGQPWQARAQQRLLCSRNPIISVIDPRACAPPPSFSDSPHHGREPARVDARRGGGARRDP